MPPPDDLMESSDLPGSDVHEETLVAGTNASAEPHGDFSHSGNDPNPSDSVAAPADTVQSSLGAAEQETLPESVPSDTKTSKLPPGASETTMNVPWGHWTRMSSLSIGELQASVHTLKTEKDALEALANRRRKTWDLVKRKAEAMRFSRVPAAYLDAVAAANASVKAAETKLDDMQWYVTKKYTYTYDSSADCNDTSTAHDAGSTRFEQDTRTVEWAEKFMRECEAVREEAMNCIGAERALLNIHARELEDQLANKGCVRKLAQARQKLETYRTLERAVECAKASLRLAEAKVESHRAGYDNMTEHAANARVYFERTEKQYWDVSERHRVEMALLMRKQRDAASARRDAKRRKLMTSQARVMCF